MSITDECREDSIKVIRAIYDLSERSITKQITIEQIKDRFRPWDTALVRDLIWYWVNKKYVKAIGRDPNRVRLFYITVEGIDCVERELLKKL